MNSNSYVIKDEVSNTDPSECINYETFVNDDEFQKIQQSVLTPLFDDLKDSFYSMSDANIKEKQLFKRPGSRLR